MRRLHQARNFNLCGPLYRFRWELTEIQVPLEAMDWEDQVLLLHLYMAVKMVSNTVEIRQKHVDPPSIVGVLLLHLRRARKVSWRAFNLYVLRKYHKNWTLQKVLAVKKQLYWASWHQDIHIPVAYVHHSRPFNFAFHLSVIFSVSNVLTFTESHFRCLKTVWAELWADNW